MIFSLFCSQSIPAFNSHLFQPITCPYGQLHVTPFRFTIKFIDSCITVFSQRGQSTISHTQMTTNSQCNVNRWSAKSSARKAAVTVYSCKFKCLRRLPVGRRQTLCKQSQRRWYIVYILPHLLNVASTNLLVRVGNHG